MTGRDAIAAIIAQADCMRVVAIDAIEVAPLQEDDEPIARPINQGIGQNFTDYSLGRAHG